MLPSFARNTYRQRKVKSRQQLWDAEREKKWRGFRSAWGKGSPLLKGPFVAASPGPPLCTDPLKGDIDPCQARRKACVPAKVAGSHKRILIKRQKWRISFTPDSPRKFAGYLTLKAVCFRCWILRRYGCGVCAFIIKAEIKKNIEALNQLYARVCLWSQALAMGNMPC